MSTNHKMKDKNAFHSINRNDVYEAIKGLDAMKMSRSQSRNREG